MSVLTYLLNIQRLLRKQFPSVEDHKTILIIMGNVILFITIILLWMFTWFFSGLLNNYYG
ncbi:hypothetical protein EIU17_04435 [Salmonella enterica]|nr:hypothetical protein [Salmonella enterica]